MVIVLNGVPRSGKSSIAKVDVGIHEDYTRLLGLVDEMSSALAGLSALIVGLHCSLEELRMRRSATGYLSWQSGGDTREPVLRWQQAVHSALSYDIEFDTSVQSAADFAAALRPLVSTQLK